MVSIAARAPCAVKPAGKPPADLFKAAVGDLHRRVRLECASWLSRHEQRSAHGLTRGQVLVMRQHSAAVADTEAAGNDLHPQAVAGLLQPCEALEARRGFQVHGVEARRQQDAVKAMFARRSAHAFHALDVPRHCPVVRP